MERLSMANRQNQNWMQQIQLYFEQKIIRCLVG